jgi:hypothetical protein
MHIRGLKLGVAAAACLWLTAGPGVLAASAATAHAGSPRIAQARHVSPFGLGIARSARAHAKPAAHVAPSKASTTTEWVSNSSPVGHNSSCASPGYETISAALQVAPSGATVKVCAGTYTEQLAITNSVALTAVGAVTVLLPASPADNLTSCDADGGAQPNQDVVDICGPGVSVSMTGFTIQGAWPSNVCNDSLYGVAVLGGARLTLAHSTVKDIGGSPLTDGCQGGVGIEVGLATSGTSADPGHATLSHDVVESYQKNGITVDGAGSHARMTAVTVEGAGPTPSIAQNGIQVSDGATARIAGARVSGDECNDSAAGCGPDGFTQTQSVGILLFDAGKTTVTRSTVTTSDIGVYNIEDFAWTYYTPPSPFTPVLESFSRMKLTNRYENAYFDEGASAITASRLNGGEIGLETAQWDGQATAPVARASRISIAGASTDAIGVASDQASGDQPVMLKVTRSSFGASNAGGVVNQSTSVISVTRDWWGASTGPSVWSFGTGSSVSSDVNFFPWAKSSARSTFESCITGNKVVGTRRNRVVLCAKPGTSSVRLANRGTGMVLLIGNAGNDRLIGSSSGETWIISGTTGTNVINGRGGTGYIQERGNSADILRNAADYTVAAN